MNPDIVNGDPALTDVGGSIMRFLITVIAIGWVADAERSHDGSVITRRETDLPMSIGNTYVPSIAVTPDDNVRTVPSG